ncbi:glutathione S-transferase family protein [Fretibacter rubidus]|uniref:glutathione S-transferase family protein n=1 Tax=Fretibacter rubidus TaxID=570162 RepID=UPI00352B48A0
MTHASITALTLHHYPLSRSVRVKWLLHEILSTEDGGDGFATVRVPLMQGGQFADDFIKKNPNHGVPVLDVTYADETTQSIYESGAIMIWLADAYADHGLAPAVTDLRARADYLQMIQLGASWMDMMLWQIRLNEDLLPRGVRSEALAQFNRDKIKNEIEPQLAARLSAHAYICGEQFTAADCMTGHNVGWARAYGLCQGDVFTQYRSRLSKRDAFVKAYADGDSFGT